VVRKGAEIMPKFQLEVAGKVMYFRDLDALKAELARKRLSYSSPCIIFNRETQRAMIRSSTKLPVFKRERGLGFAQVA
jgi:hypothetical protein